MCISVGIEGAMSVVKPTLYNAWFCPFAQRAWIALLHKGVDFDYVEQNPYNKTEEWLAINPRGLVPAIRHHGQVVVESSICIEYVDEAFTQGPALMPKTPPERAHVRIWGDFISKKIVPHYYAALMKKAPEEKADAMSSFIKGIATLTDAKSKDGPFFMGNEFGFVDIMIVPYFIRLDILGAYCDFRLPENATFSELKKWKDSTMELDSVKGTLADKNELLAQYKRYADGSAKSEVADAIREGKALP